MPRLSRGITHQSPIDAQTINLVVDANQGSELLAFVTPKTDDPIETAPVVRLKVSVVNKLNDSKVTGPIDFESVNPKRPWNVSCEWNAREFLVVTRLTKIHLHGGKRRDDRLRD